MIEHPPDAHPGAALFSPLTTAQDLIEIQPAYEQLPWEVDWDVEGQGHSSKVAHLLRRLREVGCAPLPEEVRAGSGC